MMSPEMMRMAQSMMQNMSPEQMQQMQQMAGNLSPEQIRQAQQQMAGLTPEQMRQAQQQMGSMGPDQMASAMQQGPGMLGAQEKYKLDAANQLKGEGNALIKAGKLEAAIEKYRRAQQNLEGQSNRQALELRKACQLNTSMCLLQLQRWGEVVPECNAVISVEPQNRKALYRRGQALHALGRSSEAVTDLQTAVMLSPPDEKEIITAKLKEAEAAASKDGKKPKGAASSASNQSSVTIEEVPATTPSTPAASADSTAALPQSFGDRLPQVDPSKMREMANMMRTNPAAVNTWTSHLQNMSQAELDRLAVAQGIAPGMLTPEMARMAASQMSSLSPDQVEQMASNLPPEQMRQFAAMTQSGPGMAGPPGGGTQAVLQAQASAPPHANHDVDAAVNALGSKSAASTSNALQTPAGAPSHAHGEREGDVETVEEVDISGPQDTTAAARPGVAGMPPGMAGLTSSPAMMQQATSMMQNPAMMAQVSSMMENVSPEQMQQMAAATGQPASNLSPEMMKSAAAMMKNMRPEEMQRMMEMAQRMQSGQQAGPPGAPGQPNMADMAKTLEDPAMADTLHRMMQDMRPEDMAGMMRQMGMGDMSTEQAQTALSFMKKLSPGQLRMVIKAQTQMQKVAQLWQWLKQHPIYLYSILVLFVLLLLRWKGYL